MRTTVHQNMLLRWVRDETVYEVWQELGRIGLADVGPDTINDVVSCPGHRLVQAWHHLLDGPQRRRAEAPGGDAASPIR